MEGLHFILFLACAVCSSVLWAKNNQGFSIWLGFLAICNLVYSMK